MLGADVLVVQALGFFGAIGQHALALVAQRQIHRSRNLFADGGVDFDLLANGFDGGVRAQEPVRQRFVLAQQSQQQVLGFDVRTAELAGLIPREEDHSPGLLRIPFKHSSYRLLPLQCPGALLRPASRRSGPAPYLDYRFERYRRGDCPPPGARLRA